MPKVPKGKMLHTHTQHKKPQKILNSTSETLALPIAQPENCDLDMKLCLAGPCENI